MEVIKWVKWFNFLFIYLIGIYMNKIYVFFLKILKKYFCYVKYIDVYKICVVLNWNVLI